jgi:hypothetical protein
MKSLTERYKLRASLATQTFADNINLWPQDVGIVVSLSLPHIFYDCRSMTMNLQQVLTGATGSLGAHILVHFLTRTLLCVVVLVRASDDKQAMQRLLANLRSRQLTDNVDVGRLKVVASDLSKERLGLNQEIYTELVCRTVHIVHVSLFLS